MNTFTSIKVDAKSDRGLVRVSNEDAYTLTTNIAGNVWQLSGLSDISVTSNNGALFVVADGMGGTNGGEVASRLAVEAIQQYFSTMPNVEVDVDFFKTHLFNAVKNAQRQIVERIKRDSTLKDMGTTVCIAWVFQNYLFVCWVGDSRVYLYRKNDNSLSSLTKDHSYVQELIDSNKITEADSFEHPDRNIITQSLGDESRPPEPGFISTKIEVLDRILLCSDGLNTMIRDHDIERILSTYNPATYTVGDLIEVANKNGGNDNITVIICDIVSLPDQPDQIQLQLIPPALQAMSSTNKIAKVSSSKKKILLIILLSVVLLLISGYFIYQWMHTPSKNMPLTQTMSNTESLKENRADTLNSKAFPERRPDYNQGKYIEDSYEIGIEDPISPNFSKKDINKPNSQKSLPSIESKNKTPNEKPEEISKAKIEIITLEFNKYYIIYDAFQDQLNCENEIKKIKKNGKTAFMGKCKGGNYFYALASKKGFNSKGDAEKIVNVPGIRIPCN